MAWGGPAVVLSDLTEALTAKGVDNSVVSLSDPRSEPRLFASGVRHVPCGNALVPRLGLPSSPRALGVLAREIKRTDVVHLHELWHGPEVASGILSRMAVQPYVVSPHGGLDPYSVRYYRRLKRLAWAAYQRRILDGASRVHALTVQEESDVLRAGVRAPVRVIPNGVNALAIEKVLRQGGDGGGPQPPYIVYLGRIDPRKGLDALIDAFSAVVAARSDVSLVLAGPDLAGLWPTLRDRAQRAGLGEKVSYIGFIDGPAKYQLLARAEAFALPSVSEGMSLSLLEALACGAACVISNRCNLPEVQTQGAGRVVEPTPTAFSSALLEILGDDGLRSSMRRNAERLARETFSIGRMADEMIRLYREVLARQPGAMPGAV